ncbi:MAG: GNAT family N-acetyltransferase [Bacteroidales bacterium]|nr:GNAT family N-acetyltransferase [Bacteroidales bacterium]
MNKEDFHIRHYVPDDFESVNDLWEKTGMGGSARADSKGVIDETLKKGGALFLLIHSNTSAIIGSSWLTNDGRRIYLHHFAIDPNFQGWGLSNMLIKPSLKFAKDQGKQIKLEVHQSNIIARDLYVKNGFKYLGEYDVYIIRDLKNLK